MLNGIWRDLVYAGRSLANARAFTFVCVVSLGIGMVPVIAIPYWARVLKTPPAGVKTEGLVEVVTTPRGTREGGNGWSYPDFVALRDSNTGIGMVGWKGALGGPDAGPGRDHELTHLLVGEIILPQTPGDGGVPRWVHEGIASYMADVWFDDNERMMRELVAAGNVPALSQLTGSGGVANPRLNDVLGHVAFDYIESRWGSASIRRFINALIVPRVDKTYDAVFDLTPAQFDAAFRQYTEPRFRPVVR